MGLFGQLNWKVTGVHMCLYSLYTSVRSNFCKLTFDWRAYTLKAFAIWHLTVMCMCLYSLHALVRFSWPKLPVLHWRVFLSRVSRPPCMMCSNPRWTKIDKRPLLTSFLEEYFTIFEYDWLLMEPGPICYSSSFIANWIRGIQQACDTWLSKCDLWSI